MATRWCILKSMENLESTRLCSRDRQSRLRSMSDTLEVLWYLPVTHLAALLWTISSWSTSLLIGYRVSQATDIIHPRVAVTRPTGPAQGSIPHNSSTSLSCQIARLNADSPIYNCSHLLTSYPRNIKVLQLEAIKPEFFKQIRKIWPS